MGETQETPEEYLTVHEAARSSRVSRPHLYRLVQAGVVPTIRVGANGTGPIRIPAREFEAWLTTSLREAGPDLIAVEFERGKALRAHWESLGRPRWAGKGERRIPHPALRALEQAEGRLYKLRVSDRARFRKTDPSTQKGATTR